MSERAIVWLCSLLYLAAVSAYVTTAVKDEEGEVVTAGDTLRRAAPFFAMIVGGLATFAVAIWLVQRFL
jgi:hypothetical protein